MPNLPNPLPSRVRRYLRALAAGDAARDAGRDARRHDDALNSALARMTVAEYAILDVLDAREEIAREDELSTEAALELYELDRLALTD